MPRKDESVVVGIDVVMPNGEAVPLMRTSGPNDAVLTYKICYGVRTALPAETR